MRHIILTCKHHDRLRWMCKEIAWTDEGGYNGSRSIFFLGRVNDKGDLPEDADMREECSCPASDLIISPEEELQRELLAKPPSDRE